MQQKNQIGYMVVYMGILRDIFENGRRLQDMDICSRIFVLVLQLVKKSGAISYFEERRGGGGGIWGVEDRGWGRCDIQMEGWNRFTKVEVMGGRVARCA